MEVYEQKIQTTKEAFFDIFDMCHYNYESMEYISLCFEHI